MNVQLFGAAISLIGLGLGVKVIPGGESTEICSFPPTTFLSLDNVLGLIVIPALVLQALLGCYHHIRYVHDRPVERRWFTFGLARF